MESIEAELKAELRLSEMCQMKMDECNNLGSPAKLFI